MANAWNNITLDKFAKIKAILKDSGRTGDEKLIGIAATLEGISEDELLGMPLGKAQDAFALAAELDSEPQRSAIRKTYLVAGWELNVTEAKDVNVAQWIDFQNYGRDLENRMADILSVVLIPKGKTYNEGYDIAALKRDLLANMTVPDALAVCFFFQRKFLKSMSRTLTCLVGWATLKRQKALRKKALKLRREISGIRRSL